MTQAVEPIAIDKTVIAVDIVSAYVSNNSVPASGLPDLIASVHAALNSLGGAKSTGASSQEKATPAQIRKSISPDYLVSFEDGKLYKTLRRHLTVRDLTPKAYRAKWGLPPDYSMTSASYSAQRSELARTLGLGHQRRKCASIPEPEAPANAASEKRRAGRPRKVTEPIKA